MTIFKLMDRVASTQERIDISRDLRNRGFVDRDGIAERWAILSRERLMPCDVRAVLIVPAGQEVSCGKIVWKRK